jgi:hypothetical protein
VKKIIKKLIKKIVLHPFCNGCFSFVSKDKKQKKEKKER